MEQVTGAVRRYHWGDPDWIPRMLGQEPDGEPVAELWFGTHPSAPCELASGSTLADAVRADPAGTTGRADAEGLPFLAKVLAAAEPLSIQLHPDTTEAREGYAREQAAGIPVDAPERTYRDDQPKPELICAITPFSAKCGLRDPDQTVLLLDQLGVPGLAPLRRVLQGGGAPEERLRAAVTWLLELDPGQAAELVGVVTDAAHAVHAERFAEERLWTVRLAAAYPGDVGVLVALLLNHVELQPGEALFLGAGNVHSYLSGTAVEVMAPSDNVVRGGLTSKHIDTDELLRLLDPRPIVPDVQQPAGPVHAYRVGGDAFGLQRLDLGGAGGVEVTGPGVLIATEGEARLTGDREVAAPRGPASISAPRGRAIFVRADDGAVTVTGTGVVHWAHA